MAILESMALGTPWLAFDVGCLKQLPGGRVVRNVEEMAAEALDLSTDRAARAELGSIGRAAVAEHYVWDAIVPQYEQLYRQLLLHR